MTLGEKLRNMIIVGATGAAAALLPVAAEAEEEIPQEDIQDQDALHSTDGYLETHVGQEATTFDLNLAVPIGERIGFYNRGRLVLDYNNGEQFDEIVGMQIYFGDEGSFILGLHGEAGEMTEDSARGFLGVRYAFDTDNLELRGTCGLQAGADFLASLDLELRQHYGGEGNLGPVVEVELYVSGGSMGHYLSRQTVHLGLGTDRWMFGAALEVIEKGNDPEIWVNYGGFGRVNWF